MGDYFLFALLAPFPVFLWIGVWFLYWAVREEVMAIKKRLNKQ